MVRKKSKKKVLPLLVIISAIIFTGLIGAISFNFIDASKTCNHPSQDKYGTLIDTKIFLSNDNPDFICYYQDVHNNIITREWYRMEKLK